MPFILLTTIGFVAGAAFSHYVVFRVMWRYFASFQTDYMLMHAEDLVGLRLVHEDGAGHGRWSSRCRRVVFFLARMGMVTARWLLRHFKYAVLANFVIAAVITPSGDPMSQAIIAVPMIGLYILSIGIAWVFAKRRSPEGA